VEVCCRLPAVDIACGGTGNFGGLLNFR